MPRWLRRELAAMSVGSRLWLVALLSMVHGLLMGAALMGEHTGSAIVYAVGIWGVVTAAMLAAVIASVSADVRAASGSRPTVISKEGDK